MDDHSFFHSSFLLYSYTHVVCSSFTTCALSPSQDNTPICLLPPFSAVILDQQGLCRRKLHRRNMSRDRAWEGWKSTNEFISDWQETASRYFPDVRTPREAVSRRDFKSGLLFVAVSSEIYLEVGMSGDNTTLSVWVEIFESTVAKIRGFRKTRGASWTYPSTVRIFGSNICHVYTPRHTLFLLKV